MKALFSSLVFCDEVKTDLFLNSGLAGKATYIHDKTGSYLAKLMLWFVLMPTKKHKITI